MQWRASCFMQRKCSWLFVVGHHAAGDGDVHRVQSVPRAAQRARAAQQDGQGSLFQRSVARALADAVDGAFNLARKTRVARQTVCRGQPCDGNIRGDARDELAKPGRQVVSGMLIVVAPASRTNSRRHACQRCFGGQAAVCAAKKQNTRRSLLLLNRSQPLALRAVPRPSSKLAAPAAVVHALTLAHIQSISTLSASLPAVVADGAVLRGRKAAIQKRVKRELGWMELPSNLQRREAVLASNSQVCASLDEHRTALLRAMPCSHHQSRQALLVDCIHLLSRVQRMLVVCKHHAQASELAVASRVMERRPARAVSCHRRRAVVKQEDHASVAATLGSEVKGGIRVRMSRLSVDKNARKSAHIHVCDFGK